MPSVTITTGSGNWIVPPHTGTIRVQAWGGGGKGSTRTTNGGGGGGGGGAYAESDLTLTRGDSLPYAVGAGSTTTSPGGDSTFNTTSVIAKGGASLANDTTGGAAGGLASGSTGATKYDGGTGGNGGAAGTAGGGGGESGGPTGAGNTGGNASGTTGGAGGTGRADAGDGGAGRGGTQGNGTNGTAPGGGGGGGYRTSSGTRTGGNGASGQLIITWTSPDGYVDGEDADGGSSSTTATVTAPIGGRALILHVHSERAAGTPNQPTVSGLGMTWTALQTYTHSVGTLPQRETLFKGIATSPTAGALTIDFGGQTQDYTAWSGIQEDGTYDVVQSGEHERSTTLSDTTAQVDLAAFADAGNLHVAIGYFDDTLPTGLSESYAWVIADSLGGVGFAGSRWAITAAAETRAAWPSGGFGVAWSIELDTVGATGSASPLIHGGSLIGGRLIRGGILV